MSVSSFFRTLDLNDDDIVTRREYMQFMRSIMAPIDISGISPPY